MQVSALNTLRYQYTERDLEIEGWYFLLQYGLGSKKKKKKKGINLEEWQRGMKVLCPGRTGVMLGCA